MSYFIAIYLYLNRWVLWVCGANIVMLTKQLKSMQTTDNQYSICVQWPSNKWLALHWVFIQTNVTRLCCCFKDYQTSFACWSLLKECPRLVNNFLISSLISYLCCLLICCCICCTHVAELSITVTLLNIFQHSMNLCRILFPHFVK